MRLELPVTSVTYSVTGMTCSGCASRLERHLLSREPILDVNVSLLTCKARVEFAQGRGKGVGTNAAAIRDLIHELGFVAEVESDRGMATLVVEFALPKARKARRKSIIRRTSSGYSKIEMEGKVASIKDAAKRVETMVGVASASLVKSPGSPLPTVRVVFEPAQVGARSILQRVQSYAKGLKARAQSAVSSALEDSVNAEFYRTRSYVVVAHKRVVGAVVHGFDFFLFGTAQICHCVLLALPPCHICIHHRSACGLSG